MPVMISAHDCDHCALKKIYYEGISIEEDDAKVYERIDSMINNARQAVEKDALESIPKELLTEESVKIYKRNAKTNYDNAVQVMKEWWELMRKKYGIGMGAKFDAYANQFFRCVDKNGVSQLTGGFRPK